MVALNGSTVLVALQFSFSNPNAIPATVKRQDRETPEERMKRKNNASGVRVIEPTGKCSLLGFLEELEAAEYEMIDAFYKERIDAKDPYGRRSYHMVRFLFARHEFVELSDEFKKVRDIIRAELQSICEAAMWRVRSFSNPFYKNGKEIPDLRTVSINLEARQPLFRPCGQPVTVWQKDKNGERVGDAPLALKADYCLRIVNDAVQLVTV
ncbi:hypothetical protein JW899_01460 [Candidatus Uhrbacteria bacterium]|nr:hypothetical protein [Candidatus Uhrbacteria bacterium]